MERRLAKRRAVKNSTGNVDQIPDATPLAWVHKGDPHYMFEPLTVRARDGPGASTAREAIAAAFGGQQGGSTEHDEPGHRIPLTTAGLLHHGVQPVGAAAESLQASDVGRPLLDPRPILLRANPAEVAPESDPQGTVAICTSIIADCTPTMDIE
jgi:hypothetical protein